jgi:hypothetical protein
MKTTALFFRLLGFATVLSGVYAIVAYDAARDWHHEASLTEITQELLLLLMITVCFITASKYRPYRTFHRFLGVVALLSLIREFNNFLGQYAFDGAWQGVVLAVLLLATPYFVRHFHSLLREVKELAASYAFGILLTGGLLLHVFSRLYGLSVIWQNVMGEAYLRKVTRVSEESIELLAYSIVAIGIGELVLLTVAANAEIKIKSKWHKTAHLENV